MLKFVLLLTKLICRHYPKLARTEMSKFLKSVALFSLYSILCKVSSSIMYSSMLKAVIERTKVFKFC